MRLRLRLMAMAMAIGAAASALATQAVHAADHQALAEQVVLAAMGPDAGAGTYVDAAAGMLRMDRSFYTWAPPDSAETPGNPPPVPASFDDARLRASLQAAYVEAEPKLRASLTAVYARLFTDEQLTALAAFYRSPAGLARVTRQRDAAHKLTDLAVKQAARVPTGDPAPEQAQMELVCREAEVETPAELAFDATPAGQALKARTIELNDALGGAGMAAWPGAVTAAEARYCAGAACGEPERKVFEFLINIYVRGR